MHAIEQEREQQILSKELKEDKKLELSIEKVKKYSKLNSKDKLKKAITDLIKPVDVENLKDKLDALKEPISYPNNYVFASLVEGIYKDDENLYTGEGGKDLHGEVVSTMFLKIFYCAILQLHMGNKNPFVIKIEFISNSYYLNEYVL